VNTMVAWLLLGVGGAICLINCYLSFLRRPLLRLRGQTEESYRPVSGFPLVGSLLVALSLLALHSRTGVVSAAVVLMLVDTGGIHWFIGSMIHRYVRARGERAS
jgi:hypothetical protein